MPSQARQQISKTPHYRARNRVNIATIPQLANLNDEQLFDMEVVSKILPFKVGDYAVENLIDWGRAPNDPMFRMLFPVREMLNPTDFQAMADLVIKEAPHEEIRLKAEEIRSRLNPHPAGQMEHNIPTFGNKVVHGVQHKYAETALLFPKRGQTCHAHCTFCFRWAQFTENASNRIYIEDYEAVLDYIESQKSISDIVITGGDPMIMATQHLEKIILPLLHERFEHVSNIRIGTKSLTFWPHRFISDPDSDDLMRLVETVTKAGKRLTFMLHLNHWRELEPPVAKQAVLRLLSAGAVLKSQAPVLARVNDSGRVWERMWRQHINLGIAPYYMFVERNTGAYRYFSMPLWRTLRIYQEAVTAVGGLSRTCRGPIMSTLNGKVEIMGTMEAASGPAFLLRYVQARSPHLAYSPFLAQFDRAAKWMTDLKPTRPDDAYYFSRSAWLPTNREKEQTPIIRLNTKALRSQSDA